MAMAISKINFNIKNQFQLKFLNHQKIRSLSVFRYFHFLDFLYFLDILDILDFLYFSKNHHPCNCPVTNFIAIFIFHTDFAF
jgi:hypothetical protein